MKKSSVNVLSLFNGINCGRIALDRAGIKVGNYYSSEIDKFCNQVTQENYPDTFQLGDINNWKSWGFDFSSINLIFAGFPCQAWSVAGKQKGNDDPRGQLVHVLIDIWKAVKKANPNVKFLFENVKMKKEFISYINDLFGVEPIEIDSALVSAQVRKRLYWTNIPNVTMPKDTGVLFSGVMAWSRSTRYPKGAKKYVEQRTRRNGKANTLTTGQGCGSFSSKNSINSGGTTRILTPNECEFLQTLPKDYTASLSKTQRYKAIGNGWTVDVITHILKGMK